ncbi:MAG TPA: methyl-accepting chemotaxis protein [Clostridia bacterium]|nr:methyl-accepting chemotaxis protein [Clostridia bacterium]
MKKQRLSKPRAVKKVPSGSRLWNRLTFVVTASVLVVLLLVMAGIYTTMNSSLSTAMSQTAEEKVELLAAQNAHVLSEYFSTMLSYARSLSIQMGQLAYGNTYASAVEITIINSLKNYLDDERVFGAHVAWEPNIVAGNTPDGLSVYVCRAEGDRLYNETQNNYAEYNELEYYEVSYETGKAHLTEPYSDSLANGDTNWIVSVSYPIKDSNGKIVGVVNFDIDAGTISELAFADGGYETDYYYTLTNSGTVLSHSAIGERVGTLFGSDEADYDPASVLEAVKSGTALSTASGVSALSGKTAYMIYSPITPQGLDQTYSSAFVVDISEVMAERDSMMHSMLLFIIIGAVVMCVITFLNIYRLVSPAKKIAKVAGELERGELNISETVKSKNEFGMIFNAICGVRNTLKELVGDTNALTQAALSGNLSYRADPEKHQGAFREIVAGVNSTLDAVIEPVNEASGVLVELSRGNLDASVQGHYMGDHAIIKHALNDTIEALRSYISELSEALHRMADGDFGVSIDREYLGEFLKLKTSVNTIAESMSSVLSEIRAAADQVSAGTIQVSGGSQAISQGATEQAASIEELTASIGAIAEQTRENAIGANKASELSVTAKERALKGSDRMEKLQSAMTEINVASESISKIIKVIDDIAFQTNILALNAAVEAARAGVHGKGFGVVAEEVRNLAARSAKAAKETAALIEGSAQKTEAGTRIADKTAEELKSIVEAVETSAKLVSDIANASNEQATAISQVNKGIEQMSQVVQTNSATAEEQAATSEELSGQAEMLKNQVGRFIIK